MLNTPTELWAQQEEESHLIWASPQLTAPGTKQVLCKCLMSERGLILRAGKVCRSQIYKQIRDS